jgi:hypothetical protein
MRIIFSVAISALCVALAVECNAGFGHGIGGLFVTPRVAYIEPRNQSVVDLTGKDSLKFRWNNVPIPAGGVECYRFKLYKGYDYDIILSRRLDRGIFEIDVPSSVFEDKATYTWRVQQRDANSMSWSRYDTWSFTIIKKNP